MVGFQTMLRDYRASTPITAQMAGKRLARSTGQT
jgi:hypothetical protein